MNPSDVKNGLLNKLLAASDTLDSLISEQSDGEDERGQWCASLFEVLFDLQLQPEAALELYQEVRDHRRTLQETGGRTFDFRVAALDYLFQEGRLMQSPKVLELQAYQTKLRLASTDELTGLYNRRFLEESIAREIHRSRRYRIPFSILFADIDNFKKLNDSYGHPSGDKVLRNFARFLTTYMRAEDTAGRYGGEEFILIMPQTDSAGAVTLGSRLVREMRKTQLHPEVKVTFSGGIATFPIHGQTVEALVENADLGLYHSKLQGKDQISTYPSEKRRSPRYPGDYLADVEVRVGEVAETRAVRVRNISDSGAALEVDGDLEVGDSVRLTVAGKDGAPAYEIRSQIVWMRKLENGYCVGARYDDPGRLELSGLVTSAGR